MELIYVQAGTINDIAQIIFEDHNWKLSIKRQIDRYFKGRSNFVMSFLVFILIIRL
jgi:hypothetical protein